MKSTDLLNPGDFHQVTHQIRELVAYAISQLETAEQDGSLPSGKFAEFLEDAAKKCPGYHGAGTELGKNQAIIEDGQTVVVDGFDVLLTVADSVFTGAVLKDPTSFIAREGAQITSRIGFASVLSKLEKSTIGLLAVATDTKAALVFEGEEHPMHDQGGHAGRITAKVSGNAVVDMVFTTAQAHIMRHGTALLCLNRTGAAGTFEIAADKSVGFRLANDRFRVISINDSVMWDGWDIGGVKGFPPTFKIDVNAGTEAVVSKTIFNYIVKNAGQSRTAALARMVPTAEGRLNYITLSGEYIAMTSGDTFLTDDNKGWKATISNGRITYLESTQ